ncbi:hypothetical protein NLM24_18275 [Nocardia zapadnayensis]|nr:hypothetical protein [Nocardia zapadnayensis]MCX0272615.1 hypothetical protein [Nocardia zapadnayensis]
MTDRRDDPLLRIGVVDDLRAPNGDRLPGTGAGPAGAVGYGMLRCLDLQGSPEPGNSR